MPEKKIRGCDAKNERKAKRLNRIGRRKRIAKSSGEKEKAPPRSAFSFRKGNGSLSAEGLRVL
ncbi:MAG TPA: hypothetical protein VHO02_08985, partial [Fibrobacteria bacterium]|nr:hypothetical protein [Fibrobacteria bacterium]